MMKNIKKMWKRIRQLTMSLGMVGYFVLLHSNRVYAGILDSIYVTGTLKMFKDARTALQLICAGFFIVAILFLELKKRASEEQEQTKYKKLQMGCIIGLILVETIVTFLGTIGSYYGVSVS